MSERARGWYSRRITCVDYGCKHQAQPTKWLALDQLRVLRRVANLVNRSEVAQQSGLALFANAGNCRQLGSEVAQLAPLAMISNRVAMRLVANHLDQAQHLRV